jgi:putative flippase GtrA
MSAADRGFVQKMGNELGLHYLLANLIAAGAGAASNYLINARWTYRSSGLV